MSRRGQICLYTIDGHRKYIDKKEKSKYISMGYLEVNPNKSLTKIEKISKCISYEDIIDYYEIQNHSAKECSEHFNLLNISEFFALLKFYNIHKSSEKRVEQIKAGKLKKYGDENYNNSSKIRKTCLERYGVDNQFKRRYIRDATESSDVRNKAKRTFIKRTGKKVWNEGEVGKQHWVIGQAEKRYKTMKKNNSFNTSKPEENLYVLLCNIFGKEDVVRQYKEERYPYFCDFYVKSKDLFIELNGNWTHGPHAFDENDMNDVKLLENWKSKTSGKDYYSNAIYVWTELDVDKFNTAKKNNLNYIAIYDYTDMCKIENELRLWHDVN